MQRTFLQKALKIVCIQKGWTKRDIAEKLDMTLANLRYACNNKTDTRHRKIKDFLHEHLEVRVTPKISCVLNDMSYKEYCIENNLNYEKFINEEV